MIIDKEMVDFLNLAIKGKENIIVLGKGSTGMTTCLNHVVSQEPIPPVKRNNKQGMSRFVSCK